MTSTTPATVEFDPSHATLYCRGTWTIAGIINLENTVKKITWPTLKKINIDGTDISLMDSSGAWQLHKLLLRLNKYFSDITLENFRSEHHALLQLIQAQSEKITAIPKIFYPNWLYRLGERVVKQNQQLISFLNFIGEITLFFLQTFWHPKRLRWRLICSTIETTGYQALPIIALLSFMIGVVLTYQTGLQLRTYGANIYIVDLLGLGVLREFGPLLTAIMIAGRTGAAFTAQLGTMKLKEEIDALRTMGVSPIELLVLPRIFGLLIALPLLTIWSDIFGVIGGMVMAKNMLDVSWYDFFMRFQQVVSINSLLVGIGKTPIFALLIASIGCFQGFQVSGDADSVGKKTTKSVVQAIFFIIVADAIFSVIFSKFKI